MQRQDARYRFSVRWVVLLVFVTVAGRRCGGVIEWRGSHPFRRGAAPAPTATRQISYSRGQMTARSGCSAVLFCRLFLLSSLVAAATAGQQQQQQRRRLRVASPPTLLPSSSSSSSPSLSSLLALAPLPLPFGWLIALVTHMWWASSTWPFVAFCGRRVAADVQTGDLIVGWDAGPSSWLAFVSLLLASCGGQAKTRRRVVNVSVSVQRNRVSFLDSSRLTRWIFVARWPSFSFRLVCCFVFAPRRHVYFDGIHFFPRCQ